MFEKALVRNLLANPGEASRWSLQGFGMLRYYLSKEVRLHVWSNDDRVANVSDIHTHPWHFTSYVVAGSIHNTRYHEGDSDHHLCYWHRKAVIECGADAKLCGEPTTVKLWHQEASRLDEGGVYSQRAEEIHHSAPMPGTVTIIQRDFTGDTEHAAVYWPDGQEWVDAKPRPATEEEVRRITGYALERWF